MFIHDDYGHKKCPYASLNISDRCVCLKTRDLTKFSIWKIVEFGIFKTCQEGFELMVHLVGGDVASSSMESVELMISIPEVKQKHFVLQKAGTRKGGIMKISSLITSNFVFIKGSSCTDCLNLSVLNIRLMLIYSIYRCGNCPRVITPRWKEWNEHWTKEQRRSCCQKALNQWRWRWP